MAKISRKLQTQKRHKRLRRYLIGSKARPRLAVFRSNNHIYAQVIDDNAQQTICSASTVDKELKEDKEKLSSNCDSSLIPFFIALLANNFPTIEEELQLEESFSLSSLSSLSTVDAEHMVCCASSSIT